MTTIAPATELAEEFSSANASPASWDQALSVLRKAELYWLSTVREDGRPHVTPLIAVWVDDALYFCTGAHERKARNLVRNAHCVMTTGCNRMDEGLDIVVEGDALRVTDPAELERVADEYVVKYGEVWRFSVRDGAFHGQEGNVAEVYGVRPATAFGFGKGDDFSQTRWRF